MYIINLEKHHKVKQY